LRNVLRSVTSFSPKPQNPLELIINEVTDTDNRAQDGGVQKT